MKNYPVSFSELIGNEHIKKQLLHMLSKNRIPHLLLFSGLEGVGKSLFAWALAAQLMKEQGDQPEKHFPKIALGQHPDIHVYLPEGKLALHAIQSLREMNEQVHFPPYEASWKVFIVHEAERMLNESANALLKTLEEPPPRTLIILLSSFSGALLPTLMSRCQVVHFKPIDSMLIEQFLRDSHLGEEEECRVVALQARGSLGKAIRSIQRKGKEDMFFPFVSLLSKGSLSNYSLLQQEIQVISVYMDKLKKDAEEMAKKELLLGKGEGAPTQQHPIFEKEIEGRVALMFIQEVRGLFQAILSWYRDLNFVLLGKGAAATDFFHSDYQDQLEQSLQRGEYKPLSEVYQAIEEADLALQRSTPLNLCLENLFLKLLPF